MCGVCGIMLKRGEPGGLAPVGDYLVKMLDSLAHRGSDSTGVAVAGEPNQGDLILRLWAGEDKDPSQVFQNVERKVEELAGSVRSREVEGAYLRLCIDYGGSVRDMAEALAGVGGVEVHSIGRSSEVIKDVGTAADLERRHGVSRMTGSHGIGHVRMATESRVDISHAHPFWARPFSDITVVHNGQLTNYHKMKRKYEDRGYHFQTENDSELIAVYLADKLSQGASLDDALTDSLEELDGTFTFLVCTADGLGYAKDRWAAKPLVTMETDDMVAVASEEVALSSVFPQGVDRIEPQENEVKAWSR